MTPLLFIAACAGNCKLWSEFANRTHANPWKCATLRRVRWLHDIGMIGFPILILWALSRTEWSFAELLSRSFAAWFVLAACGIGFLWLAFDAVRHLFRPKPVGYQLLDATLHNAAAHLEAAPVGNGPGASITKWPGNDVFHLEVTHKRFELPGYPAAAKPLRILHLTDWHFSGTPDKPYYDYVTDIAAGLEYDMIVFTGDLIDRLSLLDWVPPTLGRLTAPLGRYFILGNHDWFSDAEHVRSFLVDQGWTNTSGEVVTVDHDGHRIAIAGNERPWLGDVPDLVATDADVRLALIHTPDLFGWARGQDADLVLVGHNHGGQIVLPVIGPVYSPSRHGVRYAAGVYRRGDTMLHVGRGLGGIHPLRVRCKPEITVIEVTHANPSDQ